MSIHPQQDHQTLLSNISAPANPHPLPQTTPSRHYQLTVTLFPLVKPITLRK